MRKKTNIFMLLLVISLIIVSLSFLNIGKAETTPILKPSFVAYSYWGTNESHMLAYPGGSFLPLTITITYLGPYTLYNVTINSTISYPLILSKGETTPSLYIPVLNPGTTLKLFGLFNISYNSEDKIYNQTLNIKYTLFETIPQTNKTIPIIKYMTLNYSVPILGYVNLKLAGFKTTPSVIYAGDTAAVLTVYLVNEGNVIASNVSAYIVTPPQLSPLYPGSNTINIGYLPPGTPINISFPLEIKNVTSSIRLLQPYETVQIPAPFNAMVILVVKGNNIDEYFDIPVDVKPSSYFVVSNVYHNTFTQGESNTYITVSLINLGNSVAKFTTVTLLPNPIITPYVSSSINPLIGAETINYTVGDVPSGGAFNVSFVISASSGISPGNYNIPIAITWYQPPTMTPMHQIIEVPITISSSFSLNSLGKLNSFTILYVIAAIVIIILVVMAIIGLRRRKH
ncbi:MAG: COG1361 S-layer family protein [Caldisphaera sp.]|uniref:COG1361 S-layer family protein n=1 Tax=Caldisphaera sp. TaxID=2060322 RepID=UPI0026A4A3B8